MPGAAAIAVDMARLTREEAVKERLCRRTLPSIFYRLTVTAMICLYRTVVLRSEIETGEIAVRLQTSRWGRLQEGLGL